MLMSMSVVLLLTLLPLFSKGGPLAVTDANLLLGRLIPDYFPKIFGKNENESLDVEASRTAFEKLAEQINESQEVPIELDEIIYGCVHRCMPAVTGFLTKSQDSSRLPMRPCAALYAH